MTFPFVRSDLLNLCTLPPSFFDTRGFSDIHYRGLYLENRQVRSNMFSEKRFNIVQKIIVYEKYTAVRGRIGASKPLVTASYGLRQLVNDKSAANSFSKLVIRKLAASCFNKL